MFLEGKIIRIKRVLNKIVKINQMPLKPKQDDIRDEKIENKLRKLHLIVSNMLFEAIKKKDYKILDVIVKDDYVRADLILDENGMNIVQYAIAKNDNELFKVMFLKYYKFIKCYFDNAPSLFTFIINKKNFDLIEFFITNKILFSKLRKENISLCLYLLIKVGNDKLLNLLFTNKDVQEMLDGRDIQSILIYFISNNNIEKIKKICEYKVIIGKCNDTYLKNVIALAIMGNNIKMMEILINNCDVLRVILSDIDVLKNVVLFAYNNNDLGILSTISKNRITCNLKCDESIEKIDFNGEIAKLRKTANLVEDSI